MQVRLDQHALDRLSSRGATPDEVIQAVRGGERFPAKFGRTAFCRNFAFDGLWRGKRYATKQVEAIAVDEDGWLVITVIVKFF